MKITLVRSGSLVAVMLAALLAGCYSLKTLQSAAEHGDAQAQNRLGNAYFDGRGVHQDYTEAARYFRMAAEQGLAEAQYNLGYAYVKGNGVPQTYAEALKWVRLAAEQGNTDAQYNLGYACEKGLGVQPNALEAYQWFNLAAAKGDARSIEHRDALTSRMSPEQVAAAQKLSTEFVPKKSSAVGK